MKYQQTSDGYTRELGGTQGQPVGHAAVPSETSESSSYWANVIFARFIEVAMQGNGFLLALWGGIGIVIGACLPFIFHVQAAIDGVPLVNGLTIGTGDKLASILFGLILAGLAVSTRYKPRFRRPIAVFSLVLSFLGFAGYVLFVLGGVIGITEQTASGLEQLSWYPNIGVLDSITGCVACLIGAIVMLCTRPPILSGNL